MFGILALSEKGRDMLKTFRLDALRLASGSLLHGIDIAFSLCGMFGGPLVAVLGGISAGRHVTGQRTGQKTGWWSSICGPGRALDTDACAILSFDYLGGVGLTTGPRRGQSPECFPEVSTFDQAELLAKILDHLGVRRLGGLVGASYGGMVGLAFAQAHPERLGGLTVIGAAHKSPPMATAVRAIQRAIVSDAVAAGNPRRGLALARALAMTTYRTAEEFRLRFDAPRTDPDSPDSFPVWTYLRARGESFAAWMDAESYLVLSRSIDLHRVDPRAVQAPLRVVSVNQDQIAPSNLCAELVDKAAGPAELVSMDSIYGHDAFLKEPLMISKILSGAFAAGHARAQ